MKKIPDLRLKGHGIVGVHHPFTEEDARRLAKQFGFSTDYPLHERLNDAADSYYLWSNAEQLPNSSTQRDFLKELERRGKALEEALINLGGAYGVYDLGQDVDLIRLKNDLHRLVANASAAISQIQKDTPGRDKELVFNRLLKMLRSIYREGTGRSDKLTYDAVQSCYDGRLYKFVCECVRIIGVRHKTLIAIGNHLKELMAEIG